MISDRSKIYSLSKFKINCEKITKSMIVKKILKFMKDYKLVINTKIKNIQFILGIIF